MYELVIPPESPCGCGSGRVFGDCHLRDGKIVLSPKSIIPPPPQTGNSHKKCLFSRSYDCDGKISGDHILSASVLRAISKDKIRLKGAGFSREHSINSDSLKTKRLCRRHNSALSPLDVEAGRLFRAVGSAEQALSGNALLPQRLYLFEGFDIERWLLKTLFATYYSRVSNVTPGTHTLPSYAIDLFKLQLAPPHGLYMPVRLNDGGQFEMRLSSSASMYLISSGSTVTGIAVTLAGLELKLIIGGRPDELDKFPDHHVFRPKYINFYQGNDIIALAFGWLDGSDQEVWLSRGDPNAPVPHNQ